MIDKIVSIKNVGNFHDCNASPEMARLTLVYGENGQGKSTLTAVLSSLATGDAGMVAGRRTLGAVGQPSVCLRCDGDNTKLRDGVWSGPQPLIEVFDERFVENNVCVGRQVQVDQRRALYDFVIGTEGVRLNATVKTLNERETSLHRDLNGMARMLAGPAKAAGLNVRDFVSQKPDPGLPSQLDAMDKMVAAAHREGDELKHLSLAMARLPEPGYDALGALLNSSVAGRVLRARQLVEEHIAHHPDSEEWIHVGLGLVTEDRCPFCGHALEGNALFEAYAVFFDAVYDEFVAQLRAAKALVEKELGDAAIERLRALVAQNQTRRAQIANYLDVATDQSDLDLDAISEAWQGLRQAMLRELDAKAMALSESFAVTVALKEAHDAFRAANSQLSGYNEANREVMISFDELQRKVSATDTTELERQAGELRARVHRLAPDMVERCEGFVSVRDELSKCTKLKQEALDRLHGYMEGLLLQYQESVNDHLGRFGASFRIEAMDEAREVGQPSASYALTVDSRAVPLKPEAEPSPWFGNVLGSGDRTTLALAFFLARAGASSALANTVVVLDDPMSSLDCFRRHETTIAILELSLKAGQVIVLSHDGHFLRELATAAQRPSIQLACAAITRCPDGVHLKEWNWQQAPEQEYIRRLSRIKLFADGGEYTELVDEIMQFRLLLEGWLLREARGELDPNLTVGRMIPHIKGATDAPLIGLKPYLDEIQRIVYYGDCAHHVDSTGNSLINTTELEARSVAQRVVALVAYKNVP